PRKYILSTTRSPVPMLSVWDGPERLCWRNTYPLDTFPVVEIPCNDAANTASRSPSHVVSVTDMTRKRMPVRWKPVLSDTVSDTPSKYGMSTTNTWPAPSVIVSETPQRLGSSTNKNPS